MLYPAGKVKLLFIGILLLWCVSLFSEENIIKMTRAEFDDLSFMQRASAEIIVENDNMVVFVVPDTDAEFFHDTKAEILSRVPADYDYEMPSIAPGTAIPAAWVVEPGNQGAPDLTSWHNYLVYTEKMLVYLYSDIHNDHPGFQFLDLQTGEKRLLEADTARYEFDEALYVVGGENVVYCAFHFHDPAINNSNMRYYWYDTRTGEDGWLTDFGYGFEGCGASDEWIIRTGSKGNGWNNQLWAYHRVSGETFEMLADSIPEQWRYDRMHAPAMNGKTLVYNYEVNVTGQRNIKVYSLGADGIYGTADDKGGILKENAMGSPYNPASIHGRYIVWNEGNEGDIGAYDMGPDELYGTGDDEGVISVCTNSAAQGNPMVHNGIAVWMDQRNVDISSDGNMWDIYGYEFSSETEFKITAQPDSLGLQGLQGQRVAINKIDYLHEGDADIYYLDMSGQVHTGLYEVQLDDNMYADGFSYVTGTREGLQFGRTAIRQMAEGKSSVIYVQKTDFSHQTVLHAYSAYTGDWQSTTLAYTSNRPLKISIKYEGDQALITYRSNNGSGADGYYAAIYDAKTNTITDQVKTQLPTGFDIGKNFALVWGDGTTHDNWMQLYETSQRSWQSVDWKFTNTPSYILGTDIGDSLVLVIRGVSDAIKDTLATPTLLSFTAPERTWKSTAISYLIPRHYPERYLSWTTGASVCHVNLDMDHDESIHDHIYTLSNRHADWQDFKISSSGSIQKPMIGEGFSLIPSLYETLWMGYVYDHASMSWLPEPVQSADGIDDCQFNDNLFLAWKERLYSSSVWVFAPGMENFIQKSFSMGETFIKAELTDQFVLLGTKYSNYGKNRLYAFIPKEGYWLDYLEVSNIQPDSLFFDVKGYTGLAYCRNNMGNKAVHAFSAHSEEWSSMEFEDFKEIRSCGHYGLVIYEDRSSQNHFQIYNAKDNQWSSAEFVLHTSRNYRILDREKMLLLTVEGKVFQQFATAVSYSPLIDYWSETRFYEKYGFPEADITQTAAIAWMPDRLRLIFADETEWQEVVGRLTTLRASDERIYCRMYHSVAYHDYYFYPPTGEIVPDLSFLEEPAVTMLSSWTAEISWKTNLASDTRLVWVYGDSYDLIEQDTLEHVKDHKVTIRGLNAGQNYYWATASVIPGVDTLHTDTLLFTTPADQEPPRITDGPNPYRIHDTEAGIWWTLDEPGTGFVAWGETSAYTDTVWFTDTSLTPVVRIYGLSKGNTYHYKVGAVDRYGNGPALSSDRTFVTENILPKVQNLAAMDSTIWGCAYMSWDPPELDSLMDKETFSKGIPVDWKVLNLGADVRGSTWSSGYLGDNSVAYCSYGDAGEAQEEWLITGPVTINNNSGGVLNFWHYGIYNEHDNAPNRVMMSTTGTDKEDFSTIWSSSDLPDYWTLVQIALDWQSNYGKTVHFAFVYNSTFGETWILDNISMDRYVDGFYEGFNDGGSVWSRWSSTGGWSTYDYMASSSGYTSLPSENTAMDRWMVSPGIQVTASHHLLGFWQSGWYADYDIYPNEVRIMTSNTDYTYSDVVLSVYPVPTEWRWTQIDLSQYIGQRVHVGFRYHSWAGVDYNWNAWFGEDWYIDDVYLFEHEPASYNDPGYKPGDKMLTHRSSPDGIRLPLHSVSEESLSKIMSAEEDCPGGTYQAPAKKPVHGIKLPVLKTRPAPSVLSEEIPTLKGYAVYGRYPWEGEFAYLGYVTQPRFIDWDTYLGQKQEYYVEAVYDPGQSQPSEKVTLSGGITPPENEYYYDSGVLGYSYWWYPGNAFANEFNFEDSLFQPSAIRFHAEKPGAVKVNLYGLDDSGYLELVYSDYLGVPQRGWQSVAIPSSVEEDHYFLAEIECRDSLFSLSYEKVQGDVSWNYYDEAYHGASVTYFIRLQGEITGEVAVSDPEDMSYRLGSNYPNPFNPVTVIPYSLAQDGETSVRIYDLSGALVKTLTDQRQTAGTYRVTWNGTDASGHPLASGVYIVKLISGEFSASQKLLLIR